MVMVGSIRKIVYSIGRFMICINVIVSSVFRMVILLWVRLMNWIMFIISDRFVVMIV